MGAPVTYRFAGQAHLRNRARPLAPGRPAGVGAPQEFGCRNGIAPPGCRTISLKKEEAMADMYTCSCGNQTWQVLEAAVRCTACGTEVVAPHMPVTEFNHMVTQELEEVLEE